MHLIQYQWSFAVFFFICYVFVGGWNHFFNVQRKPDIFRWNVSCVDIIVKHLAYAHRLNCKWQKPFGKRQACL